MVALLACHSLLLILARTCGESFDFLLLLRNNEFVRLNRIPLGQIHDLSLKTVDGQGLRGGDLEHPFDVDDYLVEVRILLFELLESFLLVDLQYLLLDPHPRSFIFFALLLQVLVNHVLEGGLRLDGANLCESPYHDILKLILKTPGFLLGFFVHFSTHEMLGHVHDVV